VTTLVSAGPAALDTLDATDQVFVADRSGLIWTVVHGQPALGRPYAVSGTPVGLAVDPATGRLYVAVHAQPPVVVVLEACRSQVTPVTSAWTPVWDYSSYWCPTARPS
jgi:DNA-binding beta-propeller fold protein YncE